MTKFQPQMRPKKIIITPQNEFVYDSCDDAVIFNISVVDENGISVPTADNLIKFTADGGEITVSETAMLILTKPTKPKERTPV